MYFISDFEYIQMRIFLLQQINYYIELCNQLQYKDSKNKYYIQFNQTRDILIKLKKKDNTKILKKLTKINKFFNNIKL